MGTGSSECSVKRKADCYTGGSTWPIDTDQSTQTPVIMKKLNIV